MHTTEKLKINNEISRKRKRKTEKVTTFENCIDAYNEKKKKENSEIEKREKRKEARAT